MRYNLLVFFLSVKLITGYSQDIIRLKTGEEIKASIVKNDEKEIQYKKWDNVNGPIYAISKDQVFSVIPQVQGGGNNADLTSKLLKEQLRRDSLYLESIKKQHEAIIAQSKAISESMSKLVEGALNQADANKENLKKQLETLAQEQQKLQDQINAMSQKSSTKGNVIYNWHEKNSATAFRSAALPGLGYMYCGQVNKGYAFMAGSYVGLIGGSLLLIKANADEAKFASYILLAGGVVTYLYQLIDAPYCAQRVNRDHGLAIKKINIEPTFSANALGIGIKININ